MIINRARCTAECSARKQSVQLCLAYLHDPWRLIFCSQHQFLFHLIWIVILLPRPSIPGQYQPNQTKPELRICFYLYRTRVFWLQRAHKIYLHLRVCIAVVDAWRNRHWRWPKHIKIRLKFFWGWSLSQTQVEHGMSVSLSQSCPFSPNVKRVSPEAASKVSTIVGIFHPCESSSSFYFHKMKMEYEGFTTFIKGFLGSRHIL